MTKFLIEAPKVYTTQRERAAERYAVLDCGDESGKRGASQAAEWIEAPLQSAYVVLLKCCKLPHLHRHNSWSLGVKISKTFNTN